MNAPRAKTSTVFFECAATLAAGFAFAALVDWPFGVPPLADGTETFAVTARLSLGAVALFAFKAALLGVGVALPYRLLVKSLPVKAWGKSSPSV